MSDGAVIELDASDRVPTPSQQRFLDARSRIAAFLGGYGSGKTSTGAEKALDLIAANPRCSGMIVAPTLGQLDKGALRAFFDVEDPDAGACPKEWISEVNIGKRYFLHPNGARTYWGTADSPKSLEGQNLTWFWLDEPGDCRLRAYQVLVGRLREKRGRWLQGFVTGTPRPGWMWEEFNSGKADRAVVHASTRENAHNLAPGYVEDLERTYSAREARVLIDGEFGLLVGAVLEEFDRKRHLIDWRYDPRLRTVAMWDPGYRRPFWAWAQYAPTGWPIPGVGKAPAGGVWVIFDEIVDENIITEVLAQRVVEKGYSFSEVFCDPAAESANPDSGIPTLKTMQGALAARGISASFRFQTDPKWRYIPTGISILRGMLMNARQEIRLYVARSMADAKKKRGVVKDFEGYAYPEPRDGHAVGDMPLKDGLHDHGVDGVRYWAVAMHLASGGPSAQAVPAR